MTRSYRSSPAGFAAVLLFLLALQVASAAEMPLQADRVLVLKFERKLVLMHRGAVLKSFWIALGRNPERPKSSAGDGRTPEY